MKDDPDWEEICNKTNYGFDPGSKNISHLPADAASRLQAIALITAVIFAALMFL